MTWPRVSKDFQTEYELIRTHLASVRSKFEFRLGRNLKNSALLVLSDLRQRDMCMNGKAVETIELAPYPHQYIWPRKVKAFTFPTPTLQIRYGAIFCHIQYISQMCYQYVQNAIEEEGFDSFADYSI